MLGRFLGGENTLQLHQQKQFFFNDVPQNLVCCLIDGENLINRGGGTRRPLLFVGTQDMFDLFCLRGKSRAIPNSSKAMEANNRFLASLWENSVDELTPGIS